MMMMMISKTSMWYDFLKYTNDADHKRTKAKSMCVNVRVCMGVYEARVLYWKGFGLDVVMLTSSGLHGSLFPSSLPKAPGCLCMTSSPKHAPLNPLRISPSSLQLRLAALQPIRFFFLSFSFLPLLLLFLVLLFSDNSLPCSLTRRRHCLGRGPDQKNAARPNRSLSVNSISPP